MDARGVKVEIRSRETVAKYNNTVTQGASVVLRLSCGHTKTVEKSVAPKGVLAYCRQCLERSRDGRD